MPRWTLSLVGALVMVGSCMVSGADGQPPTDFDFVTAMYGPWDVEELANFSWDAKYRNSEWLHSGRERVLRAFAEESIRAESVNVTYIAGLYYHMAPWDRLDFNYSRLVRYSGERDRFTPSPVDKTWWNTLVHEPALAVANLSLHCPVWGLVWDIELYGNDVTEREDYSYDLPALGMFAETVGISVPEISTTGGHNWLKQAGLLEEYHEWIYQEVYDMADETEKAVHAINPDFALGILGTVDSWHHWAILQGFNSSTAPVTSWCEYTYGGYRTLGKQGVDHFQDLWDQHDLNGKFLPGVRPSTEFSDFMWNFGMAARHNGAFWVYQHNGDPFAHLPSETFIEMYKVYNDFVYFDGDDVYPLPSFEMLPGAGGMPFMDPSTGLVSLLIYLLDEEAPLGFDLITDSKEIIYVGENLTRKHFILGSPNLSLRASDLPCFVYGLSTEDLGRTEAWAYVRELEALLGLLEEAGLAEPPNAERLLADAIEAYRGGNHEDVVSLLAGSRNEAYQFVFNTTGQLVEDGFADPRASEIPLEVIRTLYLAENRYFRDSPDTVKGAEYLPGSLLTVRRGEMLLFQGLHELIAVEEPLAYIVTLTMSGFMIVRAITRRDVTALASGRPGRSRLEEIGWRFEERLFLLLFPPEQDAGKAEVRQ